MNNLLTDDKMTTVMQMARKPRIHYPGALYHVMAKGNNGEEVLKDEIDKKKYLEIIERYKEKQDFTLYAYCIMDNHVHLLIQVADTPLSQIMQRIQQVYTQWFNKRQKRTGHVFQQRYKALLCDKDNYLLQLVKYIHLNPVKGNLAGGILYPWSSHRFYLGKKGNLVNTTYVLSLFSQKKKEAVDQYLKFLNQKDINTGEGVNAGTAINTEIKYLNADDLLPSQLPAKKVEEDAVETISIDRIIETVAENEEILISDISRKTRKQKISDIRKAIVLLNDKYSEASNIQLSEKLNVSPSMISKIKSQDGPQSDGVEKIMDRWEKENK
ncbi:REP element-mobilizing transposase RayT [Tindallia magadiensis]|uniref:REP element-mobilizing transposase RayT n=1 Tax=Tindallia magadiensis TaxID=69895 RepID=A0A1I3H592_9FIRM|nr:transposase [Tindallia magadiensis]SFI30727.1 REP element-mobilizing transposase RayT [Tindallia magadiensis]